jgi:hypothetical protein
VLTVIHCAQHIAWDLEWSRMCRDELFNHPHVWCYQRVQQYQYSIIVIGKQCNIQQESFSMRIKLRYSPSVKGGMYDSVRTRPQMALCVHQICRWTVLTRVSELGAPLPRCRPLCLPTNRV